MTIPLVADVPQNMQFPNGLLFNNCLKVKVTRCLNWRDNNFAESGDVHMMITYDGHMRGPRHSDQDGTLGPGQGH